MGEARADRLHCASVLRALGRQGHAAGHDNAGQVAAAGQGDHRGRQPLVAGGHAQYAIARRQGADHAPHHQGGVIAISQAVHHAARALRAPVAGVGAINGEGNRVLGADGLRRFFDEQADLPMSGVIPKRDRAAVFGAQAAFGADDHILLAVDLFGMPAHGHILRHREEVAAGFIEQHVFIEWQRAFPTLPAGARRPQQLRPAVDVLVHVFVSYFSTERSETIFHPPTAVGAIYQIAQKIRTATATDERATHRVAPTFCCFSQVSSVSSAPYVVRITVPFPLVGTNYDTEAICESNGHRHRRRRRHRL